MKKIICAVIGHKWGERYYRYGLGRIDYGAIATGNRQKCLRCHKVRVVRVKAL